MNAYDAAADLIPKFKLAEFNARAYDVHIQRLKDELADCLNSQAKWWESAKKIHRQAKQYKKKGDRLLRKARRRSWFHRG